MANMLLLTLVITGAIVCHTMPPITVFAGLSSFVGSVLYAASVYFGVLVMFIFALIVIELLAFIMGQAVGLVFS